MDSTVRNTGVGVLISDAALKEADIEISRLIGEGFGLFWIADAYNVPVIRLGNDYQLEVDLNYQELPSYLKGQPGVLTLSYLRQQLAIKVMEIWRNEEEAQAAKIVDVQRARAMPGMWRHAQSGYRYMDNDRHRQIAVR